MAGAVSQPGVCILGHPQGRRFNVRPGVMADWEQVFAVAARRQVAIEIDGSWDRQDVHYALAALPQDRIVNYWSEKRFLEWARGSWDR